MVKYGVLNKTTYLPDYVYFVNYDRRSYVICELFTTTNNNNPMIFITIVV